MPLFRKRPLQWRQSLGTILRKTTFLACDQDGEFRAFPQI